MKPSAIILAGGRSSRIGYNKLEIKIENVPLLIDLIIKLQFFCEEILISTSKKNMPIITANIEKMDAYKKEYGFEKTEIKGLLEDFSAKDIKKNKSKNYDLFCNVSNFDKESLLSVFKNLK